MELDTENSIAVSWRALRPEAHSALHLDRLLLRRFVVNSNASVLPSRRKLRGVSTKVDSEDLIVLLLESM